MADRGRDLKVSIISDAEKFDLTKPAQELDALGQSAKDTSRDIDSATDKISHSVESVGTDAQETARKVDSAFDKIAASSKSNLRKVNEDADHAKKGLDDLKDEAHQSGREAAASFSGGFSDVTDFVQETLANALGGFGAIGGAIGIAAAAGLGFLTSQAQEAADRIKEVRQNLRDLGSSADTTKLDRVKDFFGFLNENADLPGLKDALDRAGVSMSDFIAAGVEGVGLDEVKRKLHDLGAEGSGLGQVFDGQVRAGQAAFDMLTQYREGAVGAADDLAIMGDVTQDTTERTENFSSALQGVSDDAADMGKAFDEGIDAVLAAQKKQLTAQADFESNMKKVFDKVGQDGVDFVLAQGENAAAAAQALADAPKKKGQEAVTNWKALGTKSSQGYADGFLSREDAVAGAASTVRAAAERILGKPVVIPTVVAPPPRSGAGSAAAAEESARRRLEPVVIQTFVGNPIWRVNP
ncbi:hypothetical protein ACWEOW_11240 [Monashia sp. NPDC004114]